MLAVLRYRRIPYRYVIKQSPEAAGLPEPKVDLMPVVYLPGPDGTVQPMIDSTPIIARLETLFAPRPVLPPDPALRLLDALIEDYADEWLTKPMFHYRWAFEADAAKAGAILPRWRNPVVDEATAARLGEAFSSRQIGRLGVVGSNATTATIIEASYARFLDILSAQLGRRRFLMGGRPGAGDFAVFGQLSQLVRFEPTPGEITLKRAPRVYAWVDLVEDLSGLQPTEDDWLPEADELSPLLHEIGRTYVPVMLANARALAAGETHVETTVDGAPWVQDPFPYQGKCVQALKAAFDELPRPVRTKVLDLLSGTGCEALLA